MPRECDNGQGLIGWNGSLAPAPIDQNQRYPFVDKKLAKTVQDWMLAVDEAMERIPQNSPITLRLYLRGRIWNFVKSENDSEEQNTMGDITPAYWIPDAIEGKSPLAFVRSLRCGRQPIVLEDCRDWDLDDEGDGIWWFHRVDGGFFLQDNVRQPVITGADPAESSTEIAARLRDQGSHKNAARWRRKRHTDRRKKTSEYTFKLAEGSSRRASIEHASARRDVCQAEEYAATQTMRKDCSDKKILEKVLEILEDWRDARDESVSEKRLAKHTKQGKQVTQATQTKQMKQGRQAMQEKCTNNKQKSFAFEDLLEPVDPRPCKTTSAGEVLGDLSPCEGQRVGTSTFQPFRPGESRAEGHDDIKW
jgi:hypothetical protein